MVGNPAAKNTIKVFCSVMLDGLTVVVQIKIYAFPNHSSYVKCVQFPYITFLPPPPFYLPNAFRFLFFMPYRLLLRSLRLILVIERLPHDAENLFSSFFKSFNCFKYFKSFRAS
jgi:hypothetical protein